MSNNADTYARRFSAAVALYGRQIDRVPPDAASLFTPPETWTPPEKVEFRSTRITRTIPRRPVGSIPYEDPAHPCRYGHTTFRRYVVKSKYPAMCRDYRQCVVCVNQARAEWVKRRKEKRKA